MAAAGLDKIAGNEPVALSGVKIRRALLAWYDKHHRRLPWRAGRGVTPDPYHVLVSETMLQQTQVATVIDYYQRFIDRFPTIEALAEADEQQVLRLWQGLGYYRRARNLHAAARRVRDLHFGEIPDTVGQLASLPGVGRYTAGAVASIAFNKQAPILDGNVARVLARWHAIKHPVTDSAVQKQLWRLAEAYVSPTRPGDFNQAMMELGATVCLRRQPRCDRCPVARLCHARRLNCAGELPIQTPSRPPQRVSHQVVAIQRRGSYLFQQRPDTGLWSAMWQLPTMELEGSAGVRASRLQAWAAQTTGLTVAPPHRRAAFRHQTTHRTIGFVVWTTAVLSGRTRRGCWRRLDGVDLLPLANPQRRAVKMIADAVPKP